MADLETHRWDVEGGPPHSFRSPGAGALDDTATHAPEPVNTPLMLHRWDSLTFVHRPFEPTDIARRLPAGLEVDTFEGAAWVGLIPFRLTIRPPGGPRLPWVSTFLETNVRTYVRGPDGRRGIWFFSLDAARLGAVVVARRTYGLPYVWSQLRLERAGSTLRYSGVRRGAKLPPAWYDLTVRVDPCSGPVDPDPLERFLTCRWRMYGPTVHGNGGLTTTQVEHPPWPLWRARTSDLRETMLAAAGLARPIGDPVVHFSPGVDVRLARRRAVRRDESDRTSGSDRAPERREPLA
jgi:uncharacterized protein YqjF (DUF2071 family)